MIRDYVEPLRVEQEFRRERLAARVPGAVLGIDASGAERELWSPADVCHCRRGGRVATGPVDEREPAVRAEHEDRPDVPARLAAILIVQRVDLPVAVGRPAGARDGGDQRADRDRWIDHPVVRRSVVVLDLLDGDEVG